MADNKFYVDINALNNEVQNFKVDNETSDPSGLTGEGQLIYRTDTNVLKYHTGSDTWVEVGTGSGSGSVTSVALTETGTALTITGSPITTSGTFNIAGAGTSSQVILGDLSLATLPVSGVTSIATTAPITGGTITSSGTIAISNAAGTTVGAAALDAGAGISLSDSSGVYTVTNSGVTSIVAGTNVTISGATGAVTINADTQGDLTAVTASTNNSYLGINVANSTGPIPEVGINLASLTALGTPADEDLLLIYDEGVPQNKKITVANLLAAAPQGDLTGLTAGTGISIANATGPVPTITNAGVTSAVASTGISVSGATGDVTFTNTGVTSAVAGSNISVSSATGAVTIAYTGGTGSMSSWIVSDGTTTQTIADGNTLLVTSPADDTAKAGIDPVVSATDTLTLNLDLEEINTVTSVATGDFLISSAVSDDDNQKITVANIHLDQWGDAEADVDFGGNKLLDVADGVASSDGVNLGQVQTLIAGTGQFKGGYNATTGLTTDLGGGNGSLDGASNIALDLGDFFVVTVDGSAFYSTDLEVGDMIFANQDISASSTPAESVYTVVIQDQNIAGAGATDGATEKGVAGFDSDNFSVTANGWVTLDTTGVTAAAYGSASETLTATVDAQGLVTAMADVSISITASQVSDFCTAVATCVADESAVATIGNGSSNEIDVTHTLGQDVIVQVVDLNNDYAQIFPEIQRTSTTNVKILTNTPIAASGAKVYIQKVS